MLQKKTKADWRAATRMLGALVALLALIGIDPKMLAGDRGDSMEKGQSEGCYVITTQGLAFGLPNPVATSFMASIPSHSLPTDLLSSY